MALAVHLKGFGLALRSVSQVSMGARAGKKPISAEVRLAIVKRAAV